MKTLSPRFLPALRRIVPLAAAVALLAGISAPAWAVRSTLPDMTHIATIGHWEISADATLCNAIGAYQNGTELHFTINAKGGAMIGVVNPNWHIPEGSYEVVTQVDRAPPQTATANAKDDWLVFSFAMNEPTINLLSYGKTMYLTIGRDRYQYDLIRSEAMLKALGACIGPRIKAANPFSDTQTNPYRPVVSNPFTGR